MRIKFTKMHGLGNDFVVIDLITQKCTLSPQLIQQLANRNYGIGFDQLLVVEPPLRPDVDFSYHIYNADGSEVEQCGNGVRCFARFVTDKKLTRKTKISVQTCSGIVHTELLPQGWVKVNMGLPKTSPAQIPMLAPTEQILYTHNVAGTPVYFSTVNMGNPHAVIQVRNIKSAPVQQLGPLLETDAIFPERANIGFMEILNPTEIKLRVFERGVGETHACGTGACAAVVAGIRQNLLAAGENINVHLAGGDLIIKWQPHDVVWMTGPTATVFEGSFNLVG